MGTRSARGVGGGGSAALEKAAERISSSFSHYMKTSDRVNALKWNMAQVKIMREMGMSDPDAIYRFGGTFQKVSDKLNRLPTKEEVQSAL